MKALRSLPQKSGHSLSEQGYSFRSNEHHQFHKMKGKNV